MQTVTIVRHAEVSEVFGDQDFVVPAAPDGGTPGSVDWLRASVARFSSGSAHERRRGLVADELSQVDTAALRREAFRRTTEVLRAADGQPLDVMAQIARAVPVGLLAEVIGLPGTPVDAVTAVARAYHPATKADRVANRALALLVDACGGVADEATAARIGLLVQACDATAGLVGNALLAVLRGEFDCPAEAIVAETLRHDPPVRSTRRAAAVDVQLPGLEVAAETLVQLDLAAANRDVAVFPDPDRFDPARDRPGRHLTFGAGPHSCPGRAHAVAIAAGIVDAARTCRLVRQDVGYEPSANLRVPARLVVTSR